MIVFQNLGGFPEPPRFYFANIKAADLPRKLIPIPNKYSHIAKSRLNFLKLNTDSIFSIFEF